MKQLITISLFLYLLFANVGLSVAGNVQTFTAEDYQNLLIERKGRAFILVFWSIDCTPCRRELSMLGKVKRQKPQLELVLVSTDSEVSQTELQAVLLRHQLQSICSYVIDDNVAQSLRYSIDPAWYGELPRSYLFDSQHRRRAVSGMLSEKFIMKWLSENE